ncbi:MAG: DUF3015 family protein [Thiotrichaceae bacterium]|nr:DUF3015 family protein [Thiotrichaceae bacterium]
MKRTAVALLLLSSPVIAFADNGPGCGLGAELWKGQTGLVAHSSAGTTNGTFSSPLSGLLSGTSGCENPGMVSNEYQKKVFVSMNMDDLAQDIAKGSGDHLSSLASLMGIDKDDQSAFYSLTQQSYEQIFASSVDDHSHVIAALDDVMRTDDRFVRYVQ